MKKIGKMKTIQTVARRKPASKHPISTTGSPSITDHSYNLETGQLTVTYHHGGKYRYSSVSPQTAEDLGKSPSAGSFLHRHIIGKHDFEKIG